MTIENKMNIKKIDETSDSQFVSNLIDEGQIDFLKQKEKVVLMKQDTPDKEIFNIENFKEIYNLQGGLVKIDIDQKMIDDLEIEYYLKYSNIKSLKEFADIKTGLDRQESN